MKIRVQVVIEANGNEPGITTQIACFERDELSEATLGLTLAESKGLLTALQETLVAQQVDAYIIEQQHCAHCGAALSQKGHHHLIMRTLFGKLNLDSPRSYSCPCQVSDCQSFSPLVEILPERATPELRYLQTKWAALMSYGMTVNLLGEVLPLEVSETSLRREVRQAAERYEEDLGDEQTGFIEGSPRDWDHLPIPDAPMIVGLDGAYLLACQEDGRKAGSFEVIVGKSMLMEGDARCFGLVNGYDVKPRRRLFETLKSQGLQMNQDVTFLSDGGDTVRDLQYYLSPQSEYLLDWFHITMRLTVMRQMLKGLSDLLPLERIVLDPDRELGGIKWFLWHGNVFKALQTLEDLEIGLEALQAEEQLAERNKLLKAVREFHGYIRVNRSFIPNYGDRYRYGEIISTAFVESTVNYVVSKRFVKKQQMRWTRRGAHLLLQVRTQVLNDDWRDAFCQWYPGMQTEHEIEALAA